MLQNDFKFLIDQFGQSVTLNDETGKRKAIVSNETVNDSMPSFDDKKISCLFPIKRGDVIEYENVLYLIISDVQAKRSFEYKAVMRPMTNTFKFTYWTEGEIDYYDRLGNPVYVEGKEPEEVTEDYPCIAQQDGSPTIEGSQIRYIDERIIVTMPDNYATQQIEINSEHQMINYTYNIVNVNLLQKGLRIFAMEWTTSSD